MNKKKKEREKASVANHHNSEWVKTEFNTSTAATKHAINEKLRVKQRKINKLKICVNKENVFFYANTSDRFNCFSYMHMHMLVQLF